MELHLATLDLGFERRAPDRSHELHLRAGLVCTVLTSVVKGAELNAFVSVTTSPRTCSSPPLGRLFRGPCTSARFVAVTLTSGRGEVCAAAGATVPIASITTHTAVARRFMASSRALPPGWRGRREGGAPNDVPDGKSRSNRDLRASLAGRSSATRRHGVNDGPPTVTERS